MAEDALTQALKKRRQISITVIGGRTGRSIKIPVWFVFHRPDLETALLIRRLWLWLTRKAAPTGVPTGLERPAPSPPQPAPHPLPPTPRRERTLVVGVDFGTSSTKVIWQDLSDNRFEMFKWSPSEQGLAALLIPSAIMVRGGAIHLGLSDRAAREGDIWLSSIKLCVLCRSNPSICRCGSSVARNGDVCLPGLAAAYPASAFACLFLAHVFREVECRLEARFPDDDLLSLWNIGCPMDYLDEARKIEWERMVGLAMELHRYVLNPSSVALLAEVASRLNSFVVASPEERNYFVQPEGLAAVKAFLESPHAESKTYAIVDIGAGTTEVSFFFNGQITGQPPRASYGSMTHQPPLRRRQDRDE